MTSQIAFGWYRPDGFRGFDAESRGDIRGGYRPNGPVLFGDFRSEPHAWTPLLSKLLTMHMIPQWADTTDEYQFVSFIGAVSGVGKTLGEAVFATALAVARSENAVSDDFAHHRAVLWDWLAEEPETPEYAARVAALKAVDRLVLEIEGLSGGSPSGYGEQL